MRSISASSQFKVWQRMSMIPSVVKKTQWTVVLHGE